MATKTPKPALPDKPKRPRGHQPTPVDVRAKHCADLVGWLGEGKTMRAFCRQLGRPNYTTLYVWMKQDAAFAQQVACARDTGYEVIADEVMEIADDASNDYMETENGPALNKEHVQRSKLRIETRLKLLACWNPRKYGNKQLLGSDPDNPLPKSNTSELIDEVLKGLALQRQKQLEEPKK